MYQGGQRVGHRGPETLAAGSRQACWWTHLGDGPREAREWMVPVPPFPIKSGALERAAEAVRRKMGCV